MIVEKTVVEFLNYIRIKNKKLEELENYLLENAYSIKYNYEVDKYDEQEVLRRYKSYLDLKSNLLKIKDAIMVYNATTIIEVEGETMSIAYALQEIRKRDDYSSFGRKLSRKMNEMAKQKNKMLDVAQAKKVELDKHLVSKNNLSKAEKEIIELSKRDYDLVIKDPLNIVSLTETLISKEDAFLDNVNTQINLKNATTVLSVDLA